jgi:wyosine [tRNA(Phe)-imidazoG37] synthetase (radical SAM superfamily)
MNYVFGPVPSRRLGQSLGIDTIPLKTCNWNCVYCQLGRTVPLTNKRRDYSPREDILAEVEKALAIHEPGEIDWITFVGSGEPTLHSDLGWLIREVKEATSLPVAAITNGSLLYLPEVRRDLSISEAVMPSLDAGSANLYRRLNRPHSDVTFERLVNGLIAFRREYTGQMWIEVMLVREFNDTESALRDIAAVLRRIEPDEVHINQPTRPPAETWVRPPDENGLARAMEILGDSAKVVGSPEGSFDLGGHETIVDAIVAIISRHPMEQSALDSALTEWAPEEVEQAMADLKDSGRAQVVERLGTCFWSAAPAHYPDDTKSQTTAPGSRRD